MGTKNKISLLGTQGFLVEFLLCETGSHDAAQADFNSGLRLPGSGSVWSCQPALHGEVRVLSSLGAYDLGRETDRQQTDNSHGRCHPTTAVQEMR